MGISAYHLLKKQHIDFFTKSFKIGLTFGLIFSIFVALEGDFPAQAGRGADERAGERARRGEGLVQIREAWHGCMGFEVAEDGP